MKIIALISLFRPKHWIKNLIVFLPIFFNSTIYELKYILSDLVVFVSFCLASSAIYCLNDVMDVESDRIHPKKCLRPVASGQVSRSLAIIFFAILVILSLSCAFFVLCNTIWVFGIVLLYIIMNIAYSTYLKMMPIIDIMVIALGFVLRIVGGGVACDITLTPWILIMIFILTLLIALAKRRSEYMVQSEAGKPQRKSVKGYSLVYMDICIGVLTTLSIMGYLMYTLSAYIVTCVSVYFYVSTIFVLCGLFRYLMLVFGESKGDDPVDMLLEDKGLLFCIIGWVLCCMSFIYA